MRQDASPDRLMPQSQPQPVIGKRIGRTATPVFGVLIHPPASLRILIVEDDVALIEAMTGLLEEQGYHVESVSRGADGVRSAIERPPALLILDLGLPDQDGLTVAA
jgi:PleD family two-component response regulator